MRIAIAIFILSAYSFSTPPIKRSKKTVKWIRTEWATGDPSTPEVDEYDIRLTMNFKKEKLTLKNSKHSYPQYSGYEIKGRKLLLHRNDIHNGNPKYQPIFSIKQLSKGQMTLEAENWAAVYITSVLSTLWVESTETDWVMNDSKDLSYGGMLQTSLELTAVK